MYIEIKVIFGDTCYKSDINYELPFVYEKNVKPNDIKQVINNISSEIPDRIMKRIHEKKLLQKQMRKWRKHEHTRTSKTNR